MSIAEGIHNENGGMTLTGDGIEFYRMLQIKQSMTMELETGLYTRANPWQAAEDYGFSGDDKMVVYNDFCDALESDPEGLIKVHKEILAKRKANRKEPVKIEATRDVNEVFHSIAGVIDITVEDVCNLITNAVDGGSSSWMVRCGDLHKQPSSPDMIPECGS